MMASRAGAGPSPGGGIAAAGAGGGASATTTRVAAAATTVEAAPSTASASFLREAPPPPAPAAGPPFSCPAIQLWEARRRAWRAGTLRMRPAVAGEAQQHQQQPAGSLPRYRGGAARRGAVALTPDEVLGMEPFGAPVPLADVIEALLEAWEEESY
jgi:hypothetical protein